MSEGDTVKPAPGGMTVWLTLEKPYDMLCVLTWATPPNQLMLEIADAHVRGDYFRRHELIAQLVLDHNMADFDGVRIPPADTKEFLDRTPEDVTNYIWGAVLAHYVRVFHPET